MGSNVSLPLPEQDAPGEDDIAIVGMACRFPGTADSPDHLWDMLVKGESAWSEFPQDRLNIDGFYHPTGRQGSIPFRGGHFISSNIAAFDAPFFGISAEEAKAVDPQQRFLLEVSYEALENGGMRKEDIDGQDVSVFVGSFVKDYEQICLRDSDDQPRYAATGNGIAIMANRLSYFYNIHGSSMTIDTGCSASLVCIHQAAETLRRGHASMAIAAGAGMILTPSTMMPMSALNFLSKDGKCFTFDHRANGYGRGEGIGVVVMKRLKDAIRDNDPIRAVIRASRLNQDGRSQGITHPRMEAQVSNIRNIYAEAGLDVKQTAYVECHGTGTQAGDVTELCAISQSMVAERCSSNPIIVGSIKPNIGHTEGSAGVAGLIKSVLVLEKGTIPPNINFEVGNPAIHFVEWKVKVPTKPMEWPVAGLRRVSVNCFGFGGTNAHVIMDQAPERTRPIVSRTKKTLTDPTAYGILVTFSAHSPSVLRRMIQNHAKYLKMESPDGAVSMLNYAFTQNCRRSNLEWRASIVACNREELASELANLDNPGLAPSNMKKKPKVCFMFCGQGAQFARMCLGLCVFRPFRRSLRDADRYLQGLGSHFSLVAELRKSSSASDINRPEISQPATTAIQIAIVDLFRFWGIDPSCVVGHSSGEIAAAYAAGLISRRTAWAVAYYRGLVAGRLRLKCPKLDGGMLAVKSSHDETQRLLDDISSSAEVACINSPVWTTVSGSDGDLVEFATHLKSESVHCIRLPVEVPYHSSYMNSVSDDYKDLLERWSVKSNIKRSATDQCIAPLRSLSEWYFPGPNSEALAEKTTPTATMYSSVTGHDLGRARPDSRYWGLNMTSPVRFSDAVTAMYAGSKPDLIIEISPKTTLRGIVRDILNISPRPPPYATVSTCDTPQTKALLKIVGQAWEIGIPVNMKNVMDSVTSVSQSCSVVSNIPSYPWDHSKTYWFETQMARSGRFRAHPRKDLIGAPSPDSTPLQPRWRGFLRISEMPWLHDHRVQKSIVYPAAGMVIQALEGASQLVSDRDDIVGYELANVSITKAMIVPETSHGLEVALSMRVSSDRDVTAGTHEWEVSSKPLDGTWSQNARGSVRIVTAKQTTASAAALTARWNQTRQECNEPVIPRQLYEHVDIIGLNYGPTFQNITSAKRGSNSCVCTVRIPDTKARMPMAFEYPHLIHPATMDAMFQSLFAIECKAAVPAFIDRMFVAANVQQGAGHQFHGFATAARSGLRDVVADIAMSNTHEFTSPAVVIEGLRLTDISSWGPGDAFLPNHRHLCAEIKWQEAADLSHERDLDKLVGLVAHQRPRFDVLQVGGDVGTCGRILGVVSALRREMGLDAPMISRYAFSGRNAARLLEQAKIDNVEGGSSHLTEERNIIGQSEPFPPYDLITTDDSDQDVDRLLPLLGPSGILIHNGSCTIHPRPNVESWTAHDGYTVHRPRKVVVPSGLTVDIIGPPASKAITIFTMSLCKIFYPNGIQLHFCTLSESSASTSEGPCIYLPELENHLLADWNRDDFDAFYQLQRSRKQILWLTRASHMDATNPRGATILGLARTIMSEDCSKRVVTLDVGEDTALNLQLARIVYDVFCESFLDHPSTATRPLETEYVERNGRVFIPRLAPIPTLNRLIEEGSATSQETDQASFLKTDNVLAMEIKRPGLDGDWFSFVSHPTLEPKLKPGEVEVEFKSSILQPVDLATSLGRTTRQFIGSDFFGVVTRSSAQTKQLRTGDQVAVFCPQATSFTNRLRVSTDAGLVKKQIFSSKWPEVGQIIPSCHIAAYYGLLYAGELGFMKDPVVLVLAGASAHGQAAIQVAQLTGARVIATTMGDGRDEQRLGLLQHRKLAESHVLCGDDADLAAQVLYLTGNQGVDVVFDATHGEVDLSPRCVRRSGRIIQVSSKTFGPRQRLHPGLSKTTCIQVDLDILAIEKPKLVAHMYENVWKLFISASGTDMEPVPIFPSHTFELPMFSDALAEIEKRPYNGMVAMTATDQTTVSVEDKNADPVSNYVSKTGAYVLVGGFGGLGLSIAQYLVENGATNLAFVSRSGPKSPGAIQALSEFKQSGITVGDYRADVCDGAEVQQAIVAIHAKMGSILGVVQCAAVIKDSMFDNMSFDVWRTAFAPKAHGSWNVVRALELHSLRPWIIFLSSSSGIIGNRSQANYAAGNSVQDSLAAYWNKTSADVVSSSSSSTHPCGGRAVSLDLGPILGAGMLVDDEQLLNILRSTGFFGIRHKDFLTVVEHAIKTGATTSYDGAQSKIRLPSQVVLGVGTGGLVRQNQPADPFWTRTAMYSLLNTIDAPVDENTSNNNGGSGGTSPSSTTPEDLRAQLASCTTPDEATEVVSAGLLRVLARSMNMLPEEMDAGRTPNAYGVDSLVAVGVRGWVVGATGVNVSVLEVVGDWTVGELAGAIVQRGGFGGGEK